MEPRKLTDKIKFFELEQEKVMGLPFPVQEKDKVIGEHKFEKETPRTCKSPLLSPKPRTDPPVASNKTRTESSIPSSKPNTRAPSLSDQTDAPIPSQKQVRDDLMPSAKPPTKNTYYEENTHSTHVERDENFSVDQRKRHVPDGALSSSPLEEVFTMQDDSYNEKRNACNTWESYRFVCAIDLGTSHSGYAYSSKEQFLQDPTKVISPIWPQANYMSKKTSTSVLYSPDGHFDSFGFQADHKYYELLLDNCKSTEARKYRIFRKFKMDLYKNKASTQCLMINDQYGNPKNATEVFADAIRYLKEDLIRDLKTQTGENTVNAKDCRWVLTVPAIWNNESRKFMIKAAVKAGIATENLMLCLEPEAAAVLCKEDKTNTYYKTIEDESNKAFNIGSKLVVVDLGGGTVDITCNEILKDGSMKELQSATGGDCGGTSVDKQFESFFSKCFKEKSYKKLQRDNECEMIDLRNEFEMRKRQFEIQQTDYVMLQIPHEVLNKLSKGQMDKLYQGRVILVKNHMKIPAEIFKTFFEPSIKNTIYCIKSILRDDHELKTILLVGGFSGCKNIRHALQEAFPEKTIINAVEPDLAVLQGAVIFGHNPAVISSRISKYWYGIEITSEITPVRSTKGNFYPIIAKGQSVMVGERLPHKFLIADSVNKQTLSITQFVCDDDTKPVLIQDSNCQRSEDLLEVNIPRFKENIIRKLIITAHFEGTAFQFSARVSAEMPPSATPVLSF